MVDRTIKATEGFLGTVPDGDWFSHDAPFASMPFGASEQ
jgi:hypothetical protein